MRLRDNLRVLNSQKRREVIRRALAMVGGTVQ